MLLCVLINEYVEIFFTPMDTWIRMRDAVISINLPWPEKNVKIRPTDLDNQRTDPHFPNFEPSNSDNG